MKHIEKSITPLIEDMFPDFYKEEGQNFIAFVEAYYQWLEQTFPSRELVKNRDIDTTVDDFILSFKEKYLKNIQFDVATNKKLMIKNSLSLFRSKGSEDSVDLFFKLVYGSRAEVKNPGELIFKLSDGQWEKPTYIEVTETTRNVDYVGSEITGTNSGASAFVERYIKRKTQNGFVAVLQISNKTKEFDNGEVLSVKRSGRDIAFSDSPRVIGSLNFVEILNSAGGFTVGEIVKLSSAFTGIGALARVSSISNVSGAVDFTFIDGGWGYTSNSLPLISEKVLFIQNIDTDVDTSFIKSNDLIYQPLLDIKYVSNSSSLQIGDLLSSNTFKGRVVSTQDINVCKVNVELGSCSVGDTFSINGSNSTFTCSVIENSTVTSFTVEAPEEITLKARNLFGEASVGDIISQTNQKETYFKGEVSSFVAGDSESAITLVNISGSPKSDQYRFLDENYEIQFDSRNDVDDTSGVWSINVVNEFSNNDLVQYESDSTPISGLTNGREYFVIDRSSSSFSLSESRAGTKISLIKTSTTETHKFKKTNSNLRLLRFASNSSFISTTENKIFLDNTGPGFFKRGDKVVYRGNTGIGLVDNSIYYISRSSSDFISLSLTPTGPDVSITSNSLNSFSNELRKCNLFFKGSSPFYLSLVDSSTNVGVHSIRKTSHTLVLTNVTDINLLKNNDFLTQFEEKVETFRFRILKITDLGGNSFEISGVIVFGAASKNREVFSDNFSSGVLIDILEQVSGGDFINTRYSKLFSTTNIAGFITRISEGFGANFDILSIGNTQDVYLNTDMLSGNSVSRLDAKRIRLNLNNSTGIAPGENIIQNIEYSFNSTSSIQDGGITLSDVSDLRVNDKLVYKSSGVNLMKMFHGSIQYDLAEGQEFFVHSIRNNTIFLKEFIDSGREILAPVSSSTHYFIKKAAVGTVKTVNGANVSLASITGEFVNTYLVILNSNNLISKTVSSITVIPPVILPSNILSKNMIREPAYGFFKSPLSNLDTIIYNSLNFQKFTLGTVNGITGINQGVDYNTAPKIRILEPFISQLNRKDFLIKVPSPSGNYVVGEEVQQTTKSLIVYDLNLQRGVEEENFLPLNFGIDSKIDIDASNDFVFVPTTILDLNPSTEVNRSLCNFNSRTNVFPITNSIGIDRPIFSVGEQVLYRKIDAPSIGLINNTTYFVSSVNENRITLSASLGGSDVQLVSNTSGLHSLSKAEDNIISFNSIIEPNTLVKYVTSSSNTIGLVSNTLYRVKTSSLSGITLKSTVDDNEITLNSSDDTSGHSLRIYKSNVPDGSIIRYDKTSGNNIGLTDTSLYFTVNSNNSGFSLSEEISGLPKDLTNTGSSETTHFFTRLQNFSINEAVYQNVVSTFDGTSNVSSNRITITNNPFSNNDIVTYYSNTLSITGDAVFNYKVVSSNSTSLQLADVDTNDIIPLTQQTGTHLLSMRIEGVVDSFRNNRLVVSNFNRPPISGYFVYSSNEQYKDLLLGFTISQKLISTKGIVKGVSNNTISVKRITLENNFTPGLDLIGTFSGTRGVISEVAEDLDSDQIGFNALIDSDVVSANGTIKTLDIIDSGLGYSNSEIIEIHSQDLTRSGSAKSIVSGSGKSKGYYRSSKGFLSNDTALLDGDYYQEYSYEVLSRVSFDRYKDMYLKVMHLAGTKVFGSVIVEEENNVKVSTLDTPKRIITNFNSTSDVIDGGIRVGDVSSSYMFNSLLINSSSERIRVNNKFNVGDRVQYTRENGVVNNIGLSNGSFYYVIDSNTSSVVLSVTKQGSPVNLTAATNSIPGHILSKTTTGFSIGDKVVYSSKEWTLNIGDKIGLANNSSVKLSSLSKNMLFGLENNKQYFVFDGNLVEGKKTTDIIVDTSRGTDNLVIVVIDSTQRDMLDMSNISLTKHEVYSGKVVIDSVTVMAENIVETRGNEIVILENLFGITKAFSKITLYTNLGVINDNNSLNLTTNQDYKLSVTSTPLSFSVGNNSGILIESKNKNITFGKNNVSGGLILFDNQSGSELESFKTVASVSNTLINSSNDFSKGDIVAYYETNNNRILNLEHSEKYFVSFANSTNFAISKYMNSNNILLTSSNTSGVLFRKENENQQPNIFAPGEQLVYKIPRNNTSIRGLNDGETCFVLSQNNSSIELAKNIATANIISISPNTITIDSDQLVRPGVIITYVPEATHTPITNLDTNRKYVITGVSGNTISINTSSLFSSSTLGKNGHKILLTDSVISVSNKTVNIEPSFDIDSNYSFILLNEQPFNNGDLLVYNVPDGSNRIEGLNKNIIISTDSVSNNAIISNNHGYLENQFVTYRTSSANSIGLSNNSLYRIKNSNTSSFQLISLNNRDIIEITSLPSAEPGHAFLPVYTVSSANSLGISLTYQLNSSKIGISKSRIEEKNFDSFSNVSSNRINVNNSFVLNERVVYTTANNITTLSGLSNNSVYFISSQNSSSFSVSSTFNGDTISLTQTRTRGFSFNNTSNVNSTTDKIQIVGHTYSSGDIVKYTSSTPIGGLTSENTYFVRNAEVDFIQLSSTVNGNIIELTATVGTSTIEAFQNNGHKFKTATDRLNSLSSVISDSGYELSAINKINETGYLLSETNFVEPLITGREYFVVEEDGVNIRLSETSNGTPINIVSDTENSTHFISKVQ